MELVTFNVGELAKKLGFKGPSLYCYDYTTKVKWAAGQQKINMFGGWTDNEYKSGNYPVLLLPTQSKLQKWLREEHDLHIEVYITYFQKLTASKLQFNWKMKKLNVNKKMQTRKSGCCHYSYEDALEEALLFTLKYIKKHEQSVKTITSKDS